MLVRIVKLEFREDKIDDFIAFFDAVKDRVNQFPGCIGMKLLQDANHPNIVMTYSHWENEKALNDYRFSDTFGDIWPKIKPWFKHKPEAWSMTEYFNGFER